MKDRFSIHVSLSECPIMVINLGKCYDYLESLRQNLRDGVFDTLYSFIDHAVVDCDRDEALWMTCIEGNDLFNDHLVSIIP